MLIAALSVALVPEGLQLNSLFGRSSDLPEPVAFPYGWAVQWLGWQALRGLTAAGTVADSHGIPLAKSAAKIKVFRLPRKTSIFTQQLMIEIGWKSHNMGISGFREWPLLCSRFLSYCTKDEFWVSFRMRGKGFVPHLFLFLRHLTLIYQWTKTYIMNWES